MPISLHLVYEGNHGNPLTVVKVNDPHLISSGAKRAIQDASEKASRMIKLDEFVGEIQLQEVEKLKKVLGMLVPELGTA